MDQGRKVKKIFKGKPEGSRGRERPILRWLEDLGKDLREIKFKRWRQKTVDKEKWAYEIKEAKALRGPQTQAVNLRVKIKFTL
jgi:hypothetical protein